jgi:hypothetical protein
MASPVQEFLWRRDGNRGLRAFVLALIACLASTACGGSDIRTDDPARAVDTAGTATLSDDSAVPAVVRTEQALPARGGTR